MQSWKNYKIIFSDFDGTLVHSDFKLSPELKSAISKWQKAGNIFSIITGKPFFGVVKNACEYLELTGPVVTNGGAIILNPKTQQIISEEYIPTDEVLKVIDFLNVKKITFEVRTNSHNYASSPKMKILKPFREFLDISLLTTNNVTFFRIPTDMFSLSIIEMVKKDAPEIRIRFVNVLRLSARCSCEDRPARG